MAQRHRLERTQLVPAPLAQVFEFLSAAQNLARLTPPFVKFLILTPLPIEMKRGQLIEYEIELGGIPMSWLTETELWQPDERFVDIQLRRPYRYWHHLHDFRDVSAGTEMRDVVDYELLLGPLGSLARALVVKRLLSRISTYTDSMHSRTAFPVVVDPK